LLDLDPPLPNVERAAIAHWMVVSAAILPSFYALVQHLSITVFLETFPTEVLLITLIAQLFIHLPASSTNYLIALMLLGWNQN
jgi:hypothetical protein